MSVKTMVSNVKTWCQWYSNKENFIKAIILVGLLICFGYFVAEDWQKFSSKSTNFKQAIQRTRFFSLPTSTVCFSPSLKKSVIEHYKLPKTPYEAFMQSKVNTTTYSLWNLFNESSYWLGKDFDIYAMAGTNNYNPIKLHNGNNDVPLCKILVSNSIFQL